MLRFLVGLAILATASSAAAGPFVVLDRIAAVVGDDVVLESDITRLAAVGMLPKRPGEGDAAYRDRVLEDRIVEVLRDRELRQTGGFTPTEAEVDAKLKSLDERLRRERGETLEAALARAKVSRAQAAEWIRRGLAIDAYAHERILPTIRVTDEDVRSYYEGPFRKEAQEKGLEALPALAAVQDELRDLLRERRLTEEIALWTDRLRVRTRVLVYRRPPASAAGSTASK